MKIEIATLAGLSSKRETHDASYDSGCYIPVSDDEGGTNNVFRCVYPPRREGGNMGSGLRLGEFAPVASTAVFPPPQSTSSSSSSLSPVVRAANDDALTEDNQKERFCQSAPTCSPALLVLKSTASAPCTDVKKQMAASASTKGRSCTVITQRKRRHLHLLRHGRLCHERQPDIDNTDKICQLPLCGKTVKLWKHVQSCDKQSGPSTTCTVPHCATSKEILKHYQTCHQRGESWQCSICSGVDPQVQQKRRRLELLCHASQCSGENEPCDNANCRVSKEMLQHFWTCESSIHCSALYCHSNEEVMKHYQHCRRSGNWSKCPICSGLDITDPRLASAEDSMVCTPSLQMQQERKSSPFAVVTQQKHSRLELFAHVSACTSSSESHCQDNRLCAKGKKLWHHIWTCRPSDFCNVSHCLSSRRVVKHHLACRRSNTECTICANVTLTLPPSDNKNKR